MIGPWQTNDNIIVLGLSLNHPNFAPVTCVVSLWSLRDIDVTYPKELNGAQLVAFNR